MRSTTFSRPLHQVVATIVALAMGVSLVAVGMAPSALANTSAEVNTLFQSSDVRIIIGGNTQSVSAGLFRLNIGGENAAAFCIDAVTSIGNLPVTFGETDFSSAITDPVKRKQILQILAHYGPNGPGGYTGAARGPVGHTISGNPGEMAAAVQAAIWHFSDGATLLNTSPTSSAEYAMYTTIVNAVKAPGNPLGDPSAPTVSLDILEPGVTEAPAGELVGPYTISSTAASVTVTKGAGVTLHNSDGSEITKTTFANGETFYLKRASQGSGEVTASANAEVKAGRAFVYKNPNERQKIILATNAIVTVTDKATAKWNKPIRHSAKVWKDINGGSAPQGGFQFTLTGGDLQAPITGNVSTDGGFAWMGQSVLTPGTYTMTETEVAGWQQRALGCDAPATGVQVNGRSVTFTIPSAHQSTKVECHFENNKLFDISIKKLVDNAQGTWADAGFDPATDTFTVAYSCTKPQQPAITGQVELKHNESKTVSGIPYGYSCGITGEPALPTLADGFAWNAPTLPDNVVVKGSGKTLTVKNKFSDNRVKFTVTKALVDLPGSGLEGDETFPVTVTCAKTGSADIVYTFDLAADGTWTSGELPTGFSCQIAEGDLPELNDGFAWQTPAISPNPVVTGQHNSATITNKVNDERVSFTVKKVLVNKADSGVDNSTTFDIDVTCTKGDDTETFEVELSHNGIWESPKLPAGYTCVAAEETLPELNDGFEWATPSVAPASITTGQGSEIVVTNTVEDPRVKLTVSKAFANAAGSGVDDDQVFEIDVECTKAGFATYEWTIDLSDGESWESPKLPAGYECVVTETIPAELEALLNDGFSFADPSFVPSDGTVTTARENVSVQVKNKVDDDRVTISVAKQLEGDLEDADVDAGTEYIVDITCTDNDSDDTLLFGGVTVKAGETTSGIGPIPIGWTCDAEEDIEALPVPADGHIWLTPEITGITVVGEGQTITIGNAVEDKRSAVTIRKDVVEGSATSGTFTFDLVKVEGDAETVIAEGIEVEVGAEAVTLADKLLGGTYRVVEHAASGWDLVGVECSVEGGGDTFTIGDTSGATIACAATNVELGSITVVKETSPADADVDFPVTLTGEGYEQAATVNATAEPVTFEGLLPGTYTLAEGEVDGWDNGPITCSVDGDELDLAEGLEVTPGDDVTCTIVNVERGSITVTKRVEGDTVTTDETVTPWVQDVVISLECDDDQDLELTLEPGAEAGTLVSTDVLDVAAGTTCVVTEVSDGVTAAGAVEITIAGVAIVEGTPSSPVTVGAGEELVIDVVNTYSGTEVEGETITPTTPTTKPTQVAGVQLPRTGAGLTQQLMVLAGALLVLGGFALALGAAKPRRQEV